MDSDAIKARLRQFISTDLLHNPEYPIKDDESLITTGLIDSFSLAQIGVLAEVEFGVYIPDAELTVDRMDTVNDMAAAILRRAGK